MVLLLSEDSEWGMEQMVFFCHPRRVFLLSLQESAASDRTLSDEETKIVLVLDQKWQRNAVNAFYCGVGLFCFCSSAGPYHRPPTTLRPGLFKILTYTFTSPWFFKTLPKICFRVNRNTTKVTRTYKSMSKSQSVKGMKFASTDLATMFQPV